MCACCCRACRPIIEAVLRAKEVVDIGACFGAARVRLLRAQMPGSHLPVYVVDAPCLYRRGGGPYLDASGRDWPDNLQRFGAAGLGGRAAGRR